MKTMVANKGKKASGGASKGKKLVVKAGGGGQSRGRGKVASIVSPTSKNKITKELRRAKDATKQAFEDVVTKMNLMEEANAKRAESSLLDQTLDTSDKVKAQYFDLKKKHDKVHEDLLQKAIYLNNNLDTMNQKLTTTAAQSSLECRDFAREYESRLRDRR